MEMKVGGIPLFILASVLWIACLPSNTEACDTPVKKAGKHNLRLELLPLQCRLLAELLTDGGTAAPGAVQGRGSTFLQSISCVIASNGCKTFAHLPVSFAGAREEKICKLSLCS